MNHQHASIKLSGALLAVAGLAGWTSVFVGQSNTDVLAAVPQTGAMSPGERSARDQAERDATRRAQSEESRRRMNEAIARNQAANRPVEKTPIYVSERYLTAKEKKLLAPAAGDQQAYAEFLRQPGTGLCRLLAVNPRLVDAKTLSEKKDLPLAGGGAYYSFTKLTHDLDKWSELRLRDGELQTGFTPQSLGILAVVGETALESTNLTHPTVKMLANYAPPSTLPEFQRQAEMIRGGLTTDGVTYKSAVPVMLNITYVLRATSYERADVLILLRVIRQAEDASVTLLWKRLASYPKPVFKPNKADSK